MDARLIGVVALALLLAWSGLMLRLGRAVRAGRPSAPEPDGSADLRWVAGSLVVVPGGFVVMMATAEARVLGLPAPFVTSLPLVVTYSALLFQAGRHG